MLLSVIVPVYNTKEYLRQCLDSIVNQDFDDYELLIIDDGSTDGSAYICDAYNDRYDHCRVIHQENRGLAEARNTGLKEAKGDWIWFVDSDDFIVDGALSSINERMRFAKAQMYGFQYIKTDEHGNNPEYIYFRCEQQEIALSNQADLLWNFTNRLLKYADGWETVIRLYNSAIIRKNDLKFRSTKEVFAEDLCFLAEYMICIDRAVMLVNYYYCYRMREGSIMNSLDQNSVIPRLLCMLEHIYLQARHFSKTTIVKNYDQICYEVMETHIPKLDELSNEEIKTEFSKGTESKLIGKYVRKTLEKLNEEFE